MSGEQDTARALTEFLTKRDNYNRAAPIEAAVQARIQQMMRELADEVVKATPGLAETLRERVKQTVAAALRDNEWLNQKVTAAVAKALTTAALDD